MTGFSADWLRLRETIDRRSRNAAVSAALHAALAARCEITVVDIGCGTGANLRATAPLLGARQDWTLVDNDMELLRHAREALSGWADTVVSDSKGLALTKDDRSIRVRFRHADVALDPDSALGDRVDLVTASAFFDLVSQSFIERFVAAIAHRTAAFYAVLTYNGVQDWLPPRAEDDRFRQAFNVHQAGDKGFGPAAGARAFAILANACNAAGYRVEVGASPWRINRDDDALMRELAEGAAAAVAATGLIDAATLEAWRAYSRSGVVVGHDDLLALPAR